MDTVEFHHSVRDGTILRISCNRVREGNTSVTYAVKVIDEKAGPHAHLLHQRHLRQRR